MTRIAYDNDPFSDRPLKWMIGNETPLETIDIARDIFQEYLDDDYTLILRQLYYQFVGRGLLTENTQKNYKNLGSLITKARNNGLISWHSLQDDHRKVNGIYRHEESDDEVVNNLEYLLSLDFWKRQEAYIEVWVEKDSLSQIIKRACRPLKVPFMATKGYLSSTMAWNAGQRFQRARNDGKECFMIHLGDHDPEGLDMTRDNEHRLIKYSKGQVDVQRIALNMDQIKEYSPPPNYAKATSSRYENYVDQFGEECWELDALEPKVLVDLITAAVEPHIDRDVWNETEEEETDKRFYLENLHEHWDAVKEHLDDLEGR